MSQSTSAHLPPHIPWLARDGLSLLSVLGGGLLGSAARAVVSQVFAADAGTFPVATLVVNIAGSFALGLFLSRRQRGLHPGRSLHLWAIGALGSFTTFSAFSVEVVQLVDAARAPLAVAYVVASVGVGLAAALLGDRIGALTR